MEIASRILKTENVNWRSLEWLQGELKEISKASFARLKQSLLSNSFIQPFNVWDDGERRWILDGHHRKRAMEELESEGHRIPEVLPANFIACGSKQDAAKLVLVYSSIYANVSASGFVDFVDNLGLELPDLVGMLDLPKLDIEHLMLVEKSKGVQPDSETQSEFKPKVYTCPQCGHEFTP